MEIKWREQKPCISPFWFLTIFHYIRETNNSQYWPQNLVSFSALHCTGRERSAQKHKDSVSQDPDGTCALSLHIHICPATFTITKSFSSFPYHLGHCLLLLCPRLTAIHGHGFLDSVGFPSRWGHNSAHLAHSKHSNSGSAYGVFTYTVEAIPVLVTSVSLELEGWATSPLSEPSSLTCTQNFWWHLVFHEYVDPAPTSQESTPSKDWGSVPLLSSVPLTCLLGATGWCLFPHKFLWTIEK